MTFRRVAAFIIAGLACCQVGSVQIDEMKSCDKVFIYSEGMSTQIKHSNVAQGIIKEATRLFGQADNIYWKPISQSDIEKFRGSNCIEIIFTNPKEIVVCAIKKVKTVLL